MNTTEALTKLLQLTQDSDRSTLARWTLPPNVEQPLTRLIAISGEIEKLQLTLQRKEAEELQLERLVLEMIENHNPTNSPSASAANQQPQL